MGGGQWDGQRLMCGITGVFVRDGRSATDFDVRGAVRSMAHRGPDETGFWCAGPVNLGMCRLSIIAPTGNHQPVQNEDGHVRAIFNGQIYNHPELRAELEGLGHRFASDGDSEVIVHAYEQWGPAFLKRLNGMFGIAIYDDRSTPLLLLARDRLGIKPLHYLLNGDGVIFGSEIKAVLTVAGHVPGPHPEGILSLLTFEYTYAPHTLFRGICKLKPGYYMKVDRNHVEMQPFWSLPTASCARSERQAMNELREVMSDAVRCRMISDVPLGAFLSGGIDSSIIVALMSRHSDRPVKTFSVGFEEASYDETHYAKQVADRYETDHTEIRLKVDLDELMTPIDLMLDDPIGDFSVFSTYLVSRAARQHVTVALSGDGGDELFGGYDTYLADRLARWYACLGGAVTRRWLPMLLSHVSPSREKKGLVNRLKMFVNGAARPADLGHARWMVFMDERLRRGLLSDAFAADVADLDPTDHVRRVAAACQFTDPTSRAMYVDASFYLPENILHKVDRTSMATSLETRVPMLDHRVAELALTVPAHFHVRGFKTKVLLKRAFADALPIDILRRGKQGFSTPMKHWLRKELSPLMMDTLSEHRIKRDGYFRTEAVEQLKNDHLAERADHAHVLWPMMLFCMWLDRYQSGSQVERRANREAVAW